MRLEFYETNSQTTLKFSSEFSIERIPRKGEHVYLPPNLDGDRGGTYEVTNTRYLYYGDPRDSGGMEVQLTGIVVYVSLLKETLGQPIPIS